MVYHLHQQQRLLDKIPYSNFISFLSIFHPLGLNLLIHINIFRFVLGVVPLGLEIDT